MTTFNPELILSTTICGGVDEKTFGVPGVTLTAKLGDFPQEAIDRFLTYGFQRFFNDGLGGKAEKAADRQTKVDIAKLKFENAKKGIVGRVKGEAVDPLMVIVLKIVKNRVKAKDALKGTDNYARAMAGKKPDLAFGEILERARVDAPETYEAIMTEARSEQRRQQERADGLAAIPMDDSAL